MNWKILRRGVHGLLVVAILLFFLFPIFWVLLMSFMSNQDILRSPPSVLFSPTLSNYIALFHGEISASGGVGALDINYARNLFNSFVLSSASVLVSLLLGVPAAYAFARYKFPLGEHMAFTLLSFRFAPPILILLPLQLYFQDIGLYDTYAGLIWVYQLITLPLILWIVRSHFEDTNPDIAYAYRLDGHSWLASFLKIDIPLASSGIAAAGLLAFIFAWNNFVFALVLGSSSVQPVTVGALAFITASGIQYGIIAAALVLSIIPTLIIALFAQRYLVEGLSLGAVKG